MVIMLLPLPPGLFVSQDGRAKDQAGQESEDVRAGTTEHDLEGARQKGERHDR